MRTGRVAGLVLAAGAGRRMGAPKALVRDEQGAAWVLRAARTLREAGCDPVTVVVGADAEAVRTELAGEPVQIVPAHDWSEGMGASLRAGLAAISQRDEGNRDPAVGVLVVPVDMPGLTPAAARRVADGSAATSLVRATYAGRPGHPVLIGRAHWAAVIADAYGDVGARDYLRTHDANEVECGDLSDGTDVDRSDRLPRGHTLGHRGVAGSS